MTRLALSLSLWLVLLGVLPGGSDAAPPEPPAGYELRARGRAVGQIPLIAVDDGHSYVSASRLAAALKGKWTVRGAHGTLKVGTRSARFTRARARVIVAGRGLTLESPPRVSSSGWLLPHDFLIRGLGRLAPGVAATTVATARSAPQPAKPRAQPARQVQHQELRYRSYPMFTRVVIETGGVLRPDTEVLAGEVRVRMPNLSVGGPSAEDVDDGLVKRIRLEPAGEGAILRASLTGVPAEVRTATLKDPHRFVIDIYRPRGAGAGVAAAQLASERAAPQPAELPVQPARQIQYQELRYRSYPTFTRVVIETGGVLRHDTDVLAGEVRVQLPDLSVGGPSAEDVDDGLVKRIRLDPAGEGAVLRASLTGVPAEVRTATLRDPHRLVIDIYRPRGAAEAVAPGTGGQGLRLIVIDPGHGGHDPGATGPSGLAEKNVVLDVSRRVARMVEEGLGIKVAMTRSTDVFIPLRDRTNFANKLRADLFVSIHANAHPRSFSQGVETYFLSSEATDKEARQVAAIENGVVQLESPAQRQKTDVLKSILWDLAQSEFQQESSFMAETVQDFMTRSLSLVNRGVKQAGFYVLGGAAMPAILIEVGFLTNPREEKKLGSPAHREAVARAIYAGLAEYKQRYDQRMRAAQTPPALPRSEPR